jgi:putative spermidine/putrescine transport system permease protein
MTAHDAEIPQRSLAPASPGSAQLPGAAGNLTPRTKAVDPWIWALAPTLIVLATLFVLPMGDLIATSFHPSNGPATVGPEFTLANYISFLTDPFLLSILLNSAVLGIGVVLFCIVLAYPTAYFLARTRSRWRGALLFCAIVPLLVSSVVRNLGWLPILSREGLVNSILLQLNIILTPVTFLNNMAGVILGLSHAVLPFLIITLTTVIQRIDYDLEEAAINLGASPFMAFWKVVLPLSKPGLLGGSLLVFTIAVAAYTTPAILGGNRVLVMATFISQEMRVTLDYALGATAAAVLMILALVLTAVATQIAAKGRGLS